MCIMCVVEIVMKPTLLVGWGVGKQSFLVGVGSGVSLRETILGMVEWEGMGCGGRGWA